jgi:membrane protein DedA with SNARE-associated domain
MSLLAAIGLFAAVVATWIAVSGPGEAALVSAGTVAARGEEQIAAVLVIAFFGTFAGSLAAYWLGRAGGRRLLLWPGPLLAWRTRLLARSEGVIQRRAFLASLLGPGWLAGINEIPPRPFIAGSALSGLLWTLTIGLGAFFVGPSLISLYDDVGKWATIAALVLAGSAALLIFMRAPAPAPSGGDQSRPASGTGRWSGARSATSTAPPLPTCSSWRRPRRKHAPRRRGASLNQVRVGYPDQKWCPRP